MALMSNLATEDSASAGAFVEVDLRGKPDKQATSVRSDVAGSEVGFDQVGREGDVVGVDTRCERFNMFFFAVEVVLPKNLLLVAGEAQWLPACLFTSAPGFL